MKEKNKKCDSHPKGCSVMKTKGINMYHEYANKAGDRYDVFKGISQQYSIKKALYPGSYVHITPSLIIPEVIYVDTDKKAINFFKKEKEIVDFIENNKMYKESSKIRFEPIDYWEEITVFNGHVDLLISQFAGFVSQACKKYLKKGGILLANDSHGDATMANEDDDFEFVGILKYIKGNYIIESDNLERYFIQRGGKPIDMDKVRKLMKGPKYVIASDYYVFRKIRD